MTQKNGTIRALLPIATLALALTACGGSSTTSADSDGGVVSLGSGPATTAAGSSNLELGDITAEGMKLKAPKDADQAMALYDKCMADGGFPKPSASGDASGGIEIESLESGDGSSGGEFPDFEKLQEVEKTCKGHLRNIDLPGVDISPEEDAALKDAERVYVKCMGDKGFDISDQLSEKGGISVDSDEAEAAEQPEWDWEAYDAANAECVKPYDQAIEKVYRPDEAGKSEANS